ncbi:DUF2243 domain-containing protein [Microcoleus sp. CAWBG58]|uniref:DUF2243 domain-containing protein n=1 Tax=Microcoleus sp. CAWBG58 TaxID=2841651 RepID=UPI0025E40B35|nr:DUF2243 domain-containing protein [Microcoleus sp. CAWBG58]
MNDRTNSPATHINNRRPLIIAGILLGIGLSGFFDGIVLHQLFQWHHMFSSVKTDSNVAGLELNTIGDGLFHAADWLVTVAGIFCLWRAVNHKDVPLSTQTFLGSILIGAGLFDFVEGIVDHQILGIHHVKPGINELAWDLGFLAIGLILALLGWMLVQREVVADS